MKLSTTLPLLFLSSKAYSSSVQAPLPATPSSPHSNLTQTCAQPPYLAPSRDFGYFNTEGFKAQVVHRLRLAIQYPTISYDGMKDPEGDDHDERWDTFPPFHDFLKDTFQLVHAMATVEAVGGYSLLFTLEGITDAKPVMLAAHLDVVPVSDAEWTFPPFEGVEHDGWVYGRGASDCKSNLIAMLSALERLLSRGWLPQRTLILAFGQDEEAHGTYGARRIAPILEDRYGRHGIEMIHDEGGAGIDDRLGVEMAVPALAEKGYADVEIKVSARGGHSSVPPKHTAIGLLARFTSALEDASPYDPVLTPGHPYLSYLHCVDTHAPYEAPKWLHSLLEKGEQALPELAERVANQNPYTRFLIQTSKAATVESGGVKANALPEEAWVVFNSRLEITSSVEEHTKVIADVLRPVAEKWDLDMDAFGTVHLSNASTTSQGSAKLSLRSITEPSPITPSDTQVFAAFAQALRSAFSEDTIVAPGVGVAGTDTKHYWDVSQNIFRWTPVRRGWRENGHAVDERIRTEAVVESAKFYHELIVKLDEAAEGEARG